MKKAIFFFIAVLSTSHLPAIAQNQLLDGSFESPSIAAGTSSTMTPTSWTASGSNRFIINGNYSPHYPLPLDGSQYVGLGNNSTLSQSFTIATSSKPALISWFDSSEFNGPNNSSPYTVAVLGSAQNVVSSIDFDANAVALRVWSPRSMLLLLSPDTYTLRFQGNVAQFGEISLIDNVSVQTAANAELHGDFNFDGVTDKNDIPVMLNALTNLTQFKNAHQLSSDPAQNELFFRQYLDADGDGKVTNRDMNSVLNYVKLKNSLAESTNVPEPANYIQLCIGTVLAWLLASHSASGFRFPKR